jgi:hypothetical protein
VIHRDLKPANVLLAADGMPKITDFGLAKKLDEAGKTQTGSIMGTPSYMAPEQAEGKSKELGPACDIYALGAVLYDCLTGRPPFRAATPLDTVLQVVSEEPVPPKQLNALVPRDLETICLKCLQKDPRERYRTAQELALDLGRFLDGKPVEARAVSGLERLLKWVKRHPATAAVYGLVLVVTVLGLIGGSMAWLWQDAETARQEAESNRNNAEINRLKAIDAEAATNKALEGEKQARAREAVAKQQVEVLNYIFQINLVGRLWQEGQVDDARQILQACKKEKPAWEWNHLDLLVHPELHTLRGP